MNSIQLPDSLVAQLQAYERKLRRMETLVAVAGGLAGLLITYVLLFAFDRFVNTQVWARAVLTITGALLAAWFAQGWARHWLWERRGPAQLAKLLQRHFRVLGDRLQGVIELTQIEELPANISPALLRAAIRQVADDSGKHHFEDAVPRRPARRWALAGIVTAALTTVPFVFVPRAATNALQRWAMPWAGVERYTFTTVETLPDDLYIPHGEPFELAVGLLPDAEWKPETATARIERQEKLAAQVQEAKALFKFPGQTRNGTLSLRFGDYLKDIAVHPLHRPELKELAARVTLPDYLGHPELRVPVNGTMADFLAGSSVSFEGKISRGVGSGSLSAGEMKLDASANAETFTTPSADIAKLGAEISLRWTDIHGLTPIQPYTLKLGTTQDAPPRVEIQNLDSQEIAILPNEEVRFTLTAADDFGLKEMWVAWTMRNLNDKPKDAKKAEKEKGKDWVAQLWDEWKTQAEVKPETNEPKKPVPELPRIAGGQTVRELTRPLVWAPAALGVPQDSVVELTGYALDYLPKREPSTSWKLTIFVLSPEKHAERVRERMDQVLKQLDERIRDEERAIEENKGIAENKEDLKTEKAGEEIKRVEAGEKANKDALDKLTEQMADVMKDALRNKEMPTDTLNEWSKIADALQKEASPKMQEAAQNMAQASQSPQQREEDMKKAMENQQAALDAMKQAGSKMKSTNENLFARNFYNRLKLAASVEHQISDGLKKLAKATVGLKPEEIGAGEKKSFEGVAGKQDGNVKDVDALQNDMTAFLRRMPNEKYQTVVSGMEEKRVVPELGELANFVRANLGLKSVGRAKSWGDQFDAWAEMLRDEAKGGGKGGGEMDPDLMELMIALVRVAVGEDNIREQTGELERAKEKNPNHAEDSGKLGTTQNQLSGTVQDIGSNPKFAKFMGDVAPLLEQVTSLMHEVAGELHKPNTGADTTAAEGIIIELLVPPDKKGGSDSQSPQMAQMQQMMQKMMQQMTKSRTAGGNNSKAPSSMEGTTAQGSTAKDKSNARTVEKTGGAGNAGEWPEEFREALQAYFQAIEERKK